MRKSIMSWFVALGIVTAVIVSYRICVPASKPAIVNVQPVKAIKTEIPVSLKKTGNELIKLEVQINPTFAP